jgi:putative transposase
MSGMRRGGRKSLGGVIYHVLNRGNGRQLLFHSPGDYDAFVRLLAEVKRAVPGVLVLAFCLMPNHFHLVLLPRRDGDLGRFMQRLLTAHVRRHHARHPGATGHLYQGRFKSFPVQQDDLHLLTLLRYVESNPLRAARPLARRPGGWRWCSFALRAAGDPDRLLDEWPVEMPRDWEALVAEPLEDRRRERPLTSLARGRPFGDEKWTTRAAGRLNLSHTLRPRGRPPKPKQPPPRRADPPPDAPPRSSRRERVRKR